MIDFGQAWSSPFDEPKALVLLGAFVVVFIVFTIRENRAARRRQKGLE